MTVPSTATAKPQPEAPKPQSGNKRSCVEWHDGPANGHLRALSLATNYLEKFARTGVAQRRAGDEYSPVVGHNVKPAIGHARGCLAHLGLDKIS